MGKKLYRSRTDKIIGGVCGGLGKYFEIDPVLIRILFVFLAFYNGSGIIIYLLMLIIIPLEPIIFEEQFQQEKFEEDLPTSTPIEKKYEARKLFGIIILVIGTLLLANNIIPSIDFEIILSIILILAGIFLIVESIKRKGN